jgi:hypothetical protein
MATNYPTQKDSWQDKVASGPIYAGDFTNLQDACQALEGKVGRNYNATDSSLDYRVNNFIVASVCMYFYENSAPTGWVATLTVGDYVCAVIASSGVYNVAGQTATGSWDMDSDITTDTHNHIWMYYSANYNYSYNSGGTAIEFSPSPNAAWQCPNRSTGIMIADGHTNNTSNDTSQYLYNLTAYTNNDTHDHTYTAGWRPAVTVGVIAYYTGA